MYHLEGFEKTIQTVVALSDFNIEMGLTLANLKTAYRRFLARVQPEIPISCNDTAEVISDEKLLYFFISFYNEPSKFHDNSHVLLQDNTQPNMKLLKEALDLIKSSDKELFYIYR